MIRNGAFQGPEFYNLVNYIFDTTLKLGSPGRDNDVKKLRDEILTALSNKATFAELVPLFLLTQIQLLIGCMKTYLMLKEIWKKLLVK